MAGDPADRLVTYERAMFRVVAGVGLALLPVFIVSVVAGPGWAAAVLLFELVVVLGVWWRRRRAAGDPPG
jgi:hypothetical protein